jgi:hypothetical protein
VLSDNEKFSDLNRKIKNLEEEIKSATIKMNETEENNR